MSNLSDISHAFMANRPNDAARALETVPSEEIASFLASCPADIAAPVLTAMGDELAAKLLVKMGASAAGGILSAMEPHEIAFVMRTAPDTERERLTAALPKRTASKIAHLLTYAPHTIGARTRSEFLTLSPDLTVAQAMKRAQESPFDLADPLFLVGEGRAYAGAVSISVFFRARPNRKLRNLTVGDLTPLYDKTPLTMVADLPVWAVYNRMPVVDARNRFVGVLSEKDLRQALSGERSRGASDAEPEASAAVTLASGYTNLMSSALNLLLGRR